MALAEIKTTRGKRQLEKVQVDWSRELSLVRIHVERVIGVLKQKFTILESLLIILVSDSCDHNSTIDKLVKVCAALVNLCSLLIP